METKKVIEIWEYALLEEGIISQRTGSPTGMYSVS
jgi:hypothetical protein